MAASTRPNSWITSQPTLSFVYALVTLSVCISTADASIYCLQCTWITSSTTKNGTCPTQNSGNKGIPCYGPYQEAPSVTYDFLGTMCWNASAPLGSGQVCAKYSYYVGNSVVNETRFAAASNGKMGCISQELDNSVRKEVCLCQDKNFCNTAITTGSRYWILLGSLLFTVLLMLKEQLLL
jgi:hypothetical protein